MTDSIERIQFDTLFATALVALRIHGPAPNIEIARAAGMAGEQFYGIVYRLRQEGLAVQSGGDYDVTEKGRRVADQIIASRCRQQKLFNQ